MDFNLAEICTMLGDRIEQYKTAEKRKLETGTTFMKTKCPKLNIVTTNSPNKNTAELTPKVETKPSTQASLSSATKLPITETPIRRVMRVHKKIISQPKKLIFYDSDDYDD